MELRTRWQAEEKDHGSKLEVHRKRAELSTKLCLLYHVLVWARVLAEQAIVVTQQPWSHSGTGGWGEGAAGEDKENCDAAGRGSGVSRGVPLSDFVLVRTRGFCRAGDAPRLSSMCLCCRGDEAIQVNPVSSPRPQTQLVCPFPRPCAWDTCDYWSLAITASVGALVLGAENPGWGRQARSWAGSWRRKSLPLCPLETRHPQSFVPEVGWGLQKWGWGRISFSIFRWGGDCFWVFGLNIWSKMRGAEGI